MNKKLRGTILLLIATIIWGSAFVSQHIVTNRLGPFTFQAARCFLAVLAMLPVIALFDRRKLDGKTFLSRWMDKKLWMAGILCGIPLFLATNLQQLGLADTHPGKSGFLTAMYIVIVPIIGILRGKRPTIMIPISVALAVCGMYCLSCIGVTGISIADLLLLGCALMFAVQITVVDIYAPTVDPLRLNALQALICGLISAGVMVFTESATLQDLATCALPIAHTGILSMGLAYGLQIFAQKDLPPAPASLLMSLESVFALLFGLLFSNETMNLWKAIGCTLIFLSVILSQIPIRNKRNPACT